MERPEFPVDVYKEDTMVTASPPERMVSHAHGDPIRIVPVHSVDEIAAPAHGATAGPPPHLTYRNGPLLSAVEVFTVFWGSAWVGPQSSLLPSLNAFFDFILTSALIDQLAEYNTPQYPIGHGRHTGTITLTDTLPTGLSYVSGTGSRPPSWKG